MLRISAPGRRVRARWTAAIAAALIGVAGAAAAQAQEPTPADVFIGVTPTSGAPIMVYVLSDSAAPGVQELATFALTVTDDAQAATTFEPERICRIVPDYSLQEAAERQALALSKAPVYGPNSEQQTVLAPDLAVFMSRESAKALLENGFVANQTEATPYFNCAGWFWSRLVRQTPDFWDRTYRELLEAQQN